MAKSASPKKAVFFGELMMSLEPPGLQRFVQAHQFNVRYTGAEANVAVSLQNWGVDTYLVSAVPPNEIGDACINTFRAFGVNTDHVQRSGQRLGTLYLETGSAQRPGKVIYDRANSAFSELRPGQIPWDEVFQDKDWFHISGTAPALTSGTAEVAVEACERAQACGVQVSMDLNFRHSLWRWDASASPAELARRTIRRILPNVNLLIANWGQAADIFDIRLADGEPSPEQHPDIACRLAAESDRIDVVALTLRTSRSASRNLWGAMLYDVPNDRAVFAPVREGRYIPYDIVPIVDRVGSGDSFDAGLIRGRLLGQQPEEMLSFSVAASCLKHAIPGDFNLVSLAEVDALAQGDTSGRIQR